MKIMIVDDNPLIRKEIAESVMRVNDAILECEDGESAVANCKSFDPDWVLMDVRMKNMNGITASEKIKQLLPGVKIAFVTSYDNYSYRKAAKTLGIKYYFLKGNLLDIRQVLDQSIC